MEFVYFITGLYYRASLPGFITGLHCRALLPGLIAGIHCRGRGSH
jgi:hypothetical protein